jgi:hypothetical protein
VAKAQINKQDTLGSSSADRETDIASRESTAAAAMPTDVHEEAITAPSHPLVVADPAERVKVRTDAIPATRVGELPGPVGTADIHGNTVGLPSRDGDPDPEGWYGGQGGITGDRTRDNVPVSEDMREAKEKRHEPLTGR